MSVIPHGFSKSLPFYLSGPTPCPYLPDRVERKLFTRLTGKAESDRTINAALTRAGFRRSHEIVYRPACPACNACVPVRIPVGAFTPSRSLRRIAARNADLRVEIVGTELTDEQYLLFQRYQQARHADSEMARMARADLAAMFNEGAAGTLVYQLRGPEGCLLGCILVDPVQDGLSAVYSFFDPVAARRSLGVQLILMLIAAARCDALPYVYLGYWIEASRKMAYKGRFQPLQRLGPEGWV